MSGSVFPLAIKTRDCEAEAAIEQPEKKVKAPAQKFVLTDEIAAKLALLLHGSTVGRDKITVGVEANERVLSEAHCSLSFSFSGRFHCTKLCDRGANQVRSAKENLRNSEEGEKVRP
jgi:hypothetical protein